MCSDVPSPQHMFLILTWVLPGWMMEHDSAASFFFKGAWLFYDTNKLYKTKLIYTLLSKSISLLPNTEFKWFVQSARNWQLGFRSFFVYFESRACPSTSQACVCILWSLFLYSICLQQPPWFVFAISIQVANQWVCHHFSERVVFSMTCWFSQVLTVVAESW